MNKDIEELLDAWKLGYGIAIDTRQFTKEELNELEKRMEEVVSSKRQSFNPSSN